MIRRLVCVPLALLVVAGMSLAGEFRAVIKKVGDGKITIAKFNEQKKDDYLPDETLTLAKDVKVVALNFNRETQKFEAGKELPGGLKSKDLAKIIGANPWRIGYAQIITDKDNKNVIQIRVGLQEKVDD